TIKTAALASEGPVTKARNSDPSPCLIVTKAPFSATGPSSSPTAATLRVNTTSESTKTLRNFIELLQQMDCRISELLCERAGTTIKQKHSHRPDDQQPLHTLHGKPAHACSSIHFFCFRGFSILLHCDHDGCRVRNSSRLGRDHD